MAMMQISPHVRWRKVGDEAVIVNQEDAEMLVLNETGCRVWELLEEGGEADTIAQVLCEEYQVDLVQAREDVRHCLDTLQDAGVISPP